jgi:cell division protein ZapA
MNSSSQSINITIFGDEYSIKGDVDSETTKKVALYVNEKVVDTCKKSASNNRLRIAILSALNIAGELFESRLETQRVQQQLDELREKTEALNRRIEASLRD